MKTRLSKVVKTAKRHMIRKNKGSQEIQLIQGSFAPAEAADILLSFINDKIKFHTVKKLQAIHENQPEAIASNKRIEELKAAKAKITDLVLKARNEGGLLEISSAIHITQKR